MAKMTIDKVLEYVDSLPLEDQSELVVTIKQRVVENLEKAHSEMEDKASALQSKINELAGRSEY